MDYVKIAIIFLTIAVIINAVGMIKLQKTIEGEIKPMLKLCVNLSPLNKLPNMIKNNDEKGIAEMFAPLSKRGRANCHIDDEGHVFIDDDDEDEYEG